VRPMTNIYTKLLRKSIAAITQSWSNSQITRLTTSGGVRQSEVFLKCFLLPRKLEKIQ
jgi:hypothetical protein